MNSFSYTNIGPRLSNEDSYVIIRKNDNTYVCIADGVGGAEHGDLASQFVVKLFKENINKFVENPIECASFINNQLLGYINDILGGERALTTFTAAIVSNCLITAVHVGDSRICILRGNGIKQLTEEHNEAGRLVREGKLKSEDKKHYPRRNIIERIMGDRQLFEPQSISFELMPCDRLLFSTDGFHDLITKKDIRDISVSSKSFEKLNAQLVVEIESRILFDNTTFVSLEV